MYFRIRRSLPARPEQDDTFWTDSTSLSARLSDEKSNSNWENATLLIYSNEVDHLKSSIDIIDLEEVEAQLL